MRFLSSNGTCFVLRLSDKMQPAVQFLAFNDSQDCFICGLDCGLRIYNTDPLVEKLNLNVKSVGSVTACSLLHRTNLVAIVGTSENSKFPSNIVRIWDDVQKQFVHELEFNAPVLSVKISYSRLVVVMAKFIHVFTFPDKIIRLATLETRDNFKGLCEVSGDPQLQYAAFPGHRSGSVQLMDLKPLTVTSSTSPVSINAHKSDLACMTMNVQGTLLATASVKGTLIRVFDTHKRTLLTELRRGSDPTNLYCLKFNPDSAFLCVSSDKGSVHVFAVKDQHLNRRSTLQKVGLLGSYAESQWGLVRISGLPECPSICGFGPGYSVIVICKDGTFHKFVFTLDGNCNREGFDMFLNIGDDEEFWKSYC